MRLFTITVLATVLGACGGSSSNDNGQQPFEDAAQQGQVPTLPPTPAPVPPPNPVAQPSPVIGECIDTPPIGNGWGWNGVASCQIPAATPTVPDPPPEPPPEPEPEPEPDNIESPSPTLIDSDNDGLTDTFENTIGTNPNSMDTDGDGLTDDHEIAVYSTNPLAIDSDGDGVTDFEEVNNGSDPNDINSPVPPPPTDTDGDGLSDTLENTIGTSPNLIDSDGDGLNDGDEFDIYFTNPLEFDSDGDGTGDFDEIIAGTDPNESNIGGTPAITCDLDSANDSWADNCELQGFGPLADSSYTRGVQRILWCQNNNNEQATDINFFADGEIGPATDASIRAYQAANPPLDIDGIVDPMTWTALRNNLELIVFSSDVDGFDAYAINGCAPNVAQFYQLVTTTLDSNGQLTTEFLGWSLAQFPGSTTLANFNSQF